VSCPSVDDAGRFMARPARERASGLAERLPAGASVAAVCRVTRHTVRFVSNDGFVLLTDRATLRSALAARKSGNDESRRQICFIVSLGNQSLMNTPRQTSATISAITSATMARRPPWRPTWRPWRPLWRPPWRLCRRRDDATTLATTLATMETTLATTLATMVSMWRPR